MTNFNPFKDENFSIFLLLTSLTLTSACTGSNNSKTSTPSHSTPSHPTTQITPNFTTPGSTTPRATSYNGVPDTFERTQIDRLKERGLTGRNIVIRLRDETHPDLRHPLLQHTRLAYEPIQTDAYLSGHALGMALIAAGAPSPQSQEGVAPEIKIITDEHLAEQNGVNPVIVSDSIDGSNLIMSCDYQMPHQGSNELRPPVNPPTNIYVVIAGNGGHQNPTNMAWRISPGHIPHWQNIIITVAVDRNNRLTSTSNACGNTERFCIGVPSNGTTSETAPIVTGTLALLMEAHPGRPLSDYVNAILETATPLPNQWETGRGLLNAEAADQYLAHHP